jgi:hypothetical protein
MKFVYEKGGKLYEFDLDQPPARSCDLQIRGPQGRTWCRKGNAEAPIKGFVLLQMRYSNDVTAQVLAEPKALLVFVLRFRIRLNGLAARSPLAVPERPAKS